MKVKVSIVQQPPCFLNLNLSIEKASDLIKQAGQNGAELVVFPETWLPGYPLWLDSAADSALWNHPPAKALFRILYENSLHIPGEQLSTLQNTAEEAGTYVIMGVNERFKGTIYNTMIFIDKDGENFKIHRKLVPTYTERLVWGRGDGSTLNFLHSDFGNIGGLICWEHWMPLARAAMHSFNETLHIAQWPSVHDLHQLASRHYAFEGGCFVLAAGTILSKGEVFDSFTTLENPDPLAGELLQQIPGGKGELLMRGGSSVIAPDSTYIVDPVFDKAEIIYAEIDLDMIAEAKMNMDSDGHYSRPDIFKLEVNDNEMRNVRFTSD